MKTEPYALLALNKARGVRALIQISRAAANPPHPDVSCRRLSESPESHLGGGRRPAVVVDEHTEDKRTLIHRRGDSMSQLGNAREGTNRTAACSDKRRQPRRQRGESECCLVVCLTLCMTHMLKYTGNTIQHEAAVNQERMNIFGLQIKLDNEMV